MSHRFDEGFTVHTASWHGLEHAVLDTWPSSLDEALPLGFPRRDGTPGYWEPVEQPMYRRAITMTDEGPTDTFEEVEGWKIVERDDDGTVLSTPRESYPLVGTKATMEIVEQLVDGGAKFDTMGSLGEGEQIYATLYLDEPTEVAGDDSPSWPFVTITNSFDMSAALRVGLSAFRTVCGNTYDATLAAWEGGVPNFTFKHSGDMDAKAKAVLANARRYFQAFAELSADLAKLPTSDEQWGEFLERFVPLPEADLVTDRQRNNVMEARSQLTSIYEGITVEAHHGTALGMFHSLVEFEDHYRKARSAESRLRRTLIKPSGVKNDGLVLVGEIHGLDLTEVAAR
jgi:phage/plasmid-like protein (TIGR03299 family)